MSVLQTAPKRAVIVTGAGRGIGAGRRPGQGGGSRPDRHAAARGGGGRGGRRLAVLPRRRLCDGGGSAHWRGALSGGGSPTGGNRPDHRDFGGASGLIPTDGAAGWSRQTTRSNRSSGKRTAWPFRSAFPMAWLRLRPSIFRRMIPT